MSNRPSKPSDSPDERGSAPPSAPRSASRRPDLDAGSTLALAERIASAPPGSVAKGIFFQAIVDPARAASGRAPGRERYLSFKDYPFTEWMEVLVECARLTYPRLAPREGLRRIGQHVFPRFAPSTLGKVLLDGAGKDVPAALSVVPRVYTAIGRKGQVTTRTVAEGRAVLALRGFWDFPDTYHVGVFEGALAAFGRTGTVRVESLSLCDADIEITWR